MARIRKKHSPAFKAQVTLEAAKQGRTIAELAKQFQVHPVQISQWKKQLLDGLETLFQGGTTPAQPDHEKVNTELYEQLGRLQMELTRVKKNPPCEAGQKRALIEVGHPTLSVRRQCQLLGPNRASYYYQPGTETTENLRLMRQVDEQYLKTPFYGNSSTVASHGRDGPGSDPPGPRTSVPNHDSKVYPYLLRDVAIERRDQV